jgi:hypothetical protein
MPPITLMLHRFISVYWTWHLGYEPFEKLGSDIFMTVSPGGTAVFTCSPEIIARVGRRHREFLKPTRLYKIVDVYVSPYGLPQAQAGNNVVLLLGT